MKKLFLIFDTEFRTWNAVTEDGLVLFYNLEPQETVFFLASVGANQPNAEVNEWEIEESMLDKVLKCNGVSNDS